MSFLLKMSTIILGFLSILAASTAQAETINCTPIHQSDVVPGPYAINNQGIYCLAEDVSTLQGSGAAIEITANNVVLDLNGHKLGGLSAGPATQAYGIRAYQRQNITIRNGIIRGFETGILLNDGSPYTTSQGHLIEGLRVDQNTFTGIAVYGHGSIIRNNQVIATGGSSLYTTGVAAIGIQVVGPANRVLDNDIATLIPQGFGGATGIYIATGDGTLAVRNRITDGTTGIYFTGATGKYRGNRTSSMSSSAYLGGTDAGDNN